MGVLASALCALALAAVAEAGPACTFVPNCDCESTPNLPQTQLPPFARVCR